MKISRQVTRTENKRGQKQRKIMQEVHLLLLLPPKGAANKSSTTILLTVVLEILGNPQKIHEFVHPSLIQENHKKKKTQQQQHSSLHHYHQRSIN